jgi:hypothetical protein
MSIEKTCNDLLNDLSVTENEKFVAFMAQCWNRLDEIEAKPCSQEVMDAIIEVRDAIGEFVPA